MAPKLKGINIRIEKHFNYKYITAVLENFIIIFYKLINLKTDNSKGKYKKNHMNILIIYERMQILSSCKSIFKMPFVIIIHLRYIITGNYKIIIYMKNKNDVIISNYK